MNIKDVDKLFMEWLVKNRDFRGLRFMLDYKLVSKEQIKKAITKLVEELEDNNVEPPYYIKRDDGEYIQVPVSVGTEGETEANKPKPSRAKAKALAKLVKKNKGNIYAIFENVKE